MGAVCPVNICALSNSCGERRGCLQHSQSCLAYTPPRLVLGALDSAKVAMRCLGPGPEMLKINFGHYFKRHNFHMLGGYSTFNLPLASPTCHLLSFLMFLPSSSLPKHRVGGRYRWGGMVGEEQKTSKVLNTPDINLRCLEAAIGMLC